MPNMSLSSALRCAYEESYIYGQDQLNLRSPQHIDFLTMSHGASSAS